MSQGYKTPISVLVVIYTADLDVLLLQRAGFPDLWQSVTGSREDGEDLTVTAIRETAEETGIDAAEHRLADWALTNRFQIMGLWRNRYAPGVVFNTEHVFGLQLPDAAQVRLAPAEHTDFLWLPWQTAADKVFSWSNRAAIRMLPRRFKSVA